MIQTQPIDINDFSGGIVDDYINCRANQAKTIDNLYILPDKSLMLREGSEIDDETNYIIPVGNQAIRTLINHNDDAVLLVQSAKKIYYRNPASYSTLQGPTGNDVFSLGDANSIVSYAKWKGHTYVTNSAFSPVQKIFTDSTSALRVRTAGLPYLASSPTITPNAVGVENYIYAFHYFYEYTVGLETFQDFGPVTYVEVANSTEPGAGTPTAITVIPVKANGATDNYDTTTLKIKIYRTESGGTTFLLIGEVTNGTTTFSDVFADAAIKDNVPIYTEGGVIENEAPPLCKFIHTVQNTTYFAYLKEGSEIRKSDVQQSVVGDPDSTDPTFRDTVEDEITGLSSVVSVPVVLCKRKIYRIDGQFDYLGRGYMTHITIHDNAGCVSNRSCVQAEQGLYWAGNDGFYYTDGYKVTKISDQLNVKYAEFIVATKATGNLERIEGTYDEKNRRIIWAVQSNSSSAENDSLWILELRWGLSDQMPFTTMSGLTTSFRPSSLTYFNKKLYRADIRGYVFVHTPEVMTDPKVDTTKIASLWEKDTIVYLYQGPASNFGTDFVRKWVPRILLTARNRSNISIQINAINDDGKNARSLAEIRYRQNFEWGDPEFIWGNENCVWGSTGIIQEWRRFPARGLRCSLLQIEITNAFTIVTNSDTLGKATVNTTLKTATLDDAVNVDWPLYGVDYYLSFPHDNYTENFLVTTRSDDTLVFSDPAGKVLSGSQKWILRGYKKEEALNLLSYTVHFAMLSKSHTNLGGQSTGANA